MPQWSRFPDPRDPNRHVEIDKKYLSEWVEYGLKDFSKLLRAHAAFDAWCIEHLKPKTEEPDETPTE